MAWLAATLAIIACVLGLVARSERRRTRATTQALADSADRLLRQVRTALRVEGIPPGGGDLDALARGLDDLSKHWQHAWQTAQEERRDLASVLAGLREAILLLDADGNVLLANRAAHGIWPRLGSRLVGMNQIVLFHDAALSEAVARARSEAGPQTVEYVRPGPPRRHFDVRMLPLAGDGGEERSGARLLLVARDVTDRYAVEQMRRDFVANVSHELQTPLATIQGCAETLRDTPELTAAEQRHFCELLLREAHRMGALVRDLLELARLESGAWALPSEAVELALLVREVVEAARPSAASKGILLETAASERATVLGRREDLRRALDNLVANAIAYTPPGGRVEVGTHLNGGEAQLLVRDSGIGIPEEDRQRIFERFYRVDRGRSRAAGGTGLGLSIVKHIVETHGGHVEVESRVDAGSTFRCVLPLAAAGAGDPADPPVAGPAGSGTTGATRLH